MASLRLAAFSLALALPHATCLLGAAARASVTRRAAVGTAAAFIVGRPRAPASANWLSSEVVEKVRIMEQEAADSKYDELAPIDDGTGGGKRLLPIIRIERQIDSLFDAAQSPAKWGEIASVLSTSTYATKDLKKAFNFYSDNIYYSDDSRANVYLLGGATPESAQTEQYLLRNEIITAVQNALLEANYLVKESAKPEGEADTDPGDLVDYLRTAKNSLREYLARADTRDIATAKKLLAAESA